MNDQEPADFSRVADALRWGEEVLAEESINGARLQATLLLGDAMGLNRAQVLASLREPVAAGAAEKFRTSIASRASHVPLQYIRGHVPFLDFEVAVRPGVFIPRPETELVVEEALALWQPTAEAPWAVDVGTGSGIISIALARARPAARICTIDRSPTPLVTARQNAASLDVADRIAFIRGDLLSPLGADHHQPPASVRQSVGMVISNPPYAPENGREVDPEVSDHEPREAWAAGPEGMDAYARLIPQAANLLLPGRPLILELGYGQSELVADLLASDGRWDEPRILPDFNEIPRIVTVLRK